MGLKGSTGDNGCMSLGKFTTILMAELSRKAFLFTGNWSVGLSLSAASLALSHLCCSFNECTVPSGSCPMSPKQSAFHPFLCLKEFLTL